MEFLVELFANIANGVSDFITFAMTWLPGDETQKRIGFWASVVTLGLFIWGAFRWVRSPAPPQAPGGPITTVDLANLKADLLAALRAKEAAPEAAPGGAEGAVALPAPSAGGDGLERDLDAAIDTLLAAGKADALKDKTGRDAEAALDRLIAERAAARDKVARDEAALWRQKGALAFLHDTPSALAAYRRASELDPDDADGWNQLGALYLRTGDLDDAITAWERVLALGNRSADQGTIAAATGNLGIVYFTRGDLDRAEEMYRKSLAIEEALGRKEGMANQYGNLGLLDEARGNIPAACAQWVKSRDLFRQLGAPHMVEKVEGWMLDAGCPDV